MLLGIIGLAAALRFCDLGGQCFFHDEIFELHVAKNSIPYIFRAISAAPVHSPLNQLISHCFLYFGHSEFILRLPAAIWGVLGVWVIYLAGTCFFNRRVGLLGAFLLAISSYHIRYSQEARMYALLVLATLLSQYFFWRVLRQGGRRYALGYILSTTLALHTHLFAVFVLAAQVIFVGLRRLLFGRTRENRAALRFFPGSLLVIFLLFLPRLIPAAGNLLSQESFVEVKVGAVPVARGWTPRSVQLTDLTTILTLFGGGTGLAFYLYFGLWVIGVEGSLKRWGGATAYLVLTAALPFVSFLVFKPARIFGVRYLIFLLPVYYLLVAAGVERLGRVAGALHRRLRPGKSWREAAYYLPVTLIFLAAGFQPLQLYYRDWNYPIGSRLKFDWWKLNSFLENHARPGDIIIPTGDIWYYHLVYLRQYLSPGLQEKLAVDTPEQLSEAGIWWVGGDPGRRQYPPGMAPVDLDPAIPGLSVSCGRGPAGFREEPLSALEESPDPRVLGVAGPIPVRGGRLFWLSLRMRGIERHYERYSPYPAFIFQGPGGAEVPDPHLGVRMVTDAGDGWVRVISNGITPSHADTVRILILKDRLHIGDKIELDGLRFFGDWREENVRNPGAETRPE